MHLNVHKENLVWYLLGISQRVYFFYEYSHHDFCGSTTGIDGKILNKKIKINCLIQNREILFSSLLVLPVVESEAVSSSSCSCSCSNSSSSSNTFLDAMKIDWSQKLGR